MKNRMIRSVAALGVTGAAVIALGATAAHADPAERIGYGLTGSECTNWGYYGERAGAWIDYWCYPRPSGYELWVQYK